MSPRLLAGVLPFLAACAMTPPPAPVASVTFLGTTYPITAQADGSWRTNVDGTSVTCSKPTEEACLWAVRHHLTAQELLDDLG